MKIKKPFGKNEGLFFEEEVEMEEELKFVENGWRHPNMNQFQSHDNFSCSTAPVHFLSTYYLNLTSFLSYY